MKRTRKISEQVYVDLWNEKNKPLWWEYGATLLHYILYGERLLDQSQFVTANPEMVAKCIDGPISERDLEVVEKVMEWLGTKEGKLFMDEAENRISKIKACRLRMFTRIFNGKVEDPLLLEFGEYMMPQV